MPLNPNAKPSMRLSIAPGSLSDPRLRSAYSTEPSPQRPAPPHRNRPNPHPNPILMLINGDIRIIHATTVSSSAS
jgi:hypothetical protein